MAFCLYDSDRLCCNRGRYHSPNRTSYSITHSFIIHKRFKHADADITDKGNEKRWPIYRFSLYQTSRRIARFYDSTESSDNHKKCKAREKHKGEKFGV